MPGAEPPRSCWYTIERIEQWLELFDIAEDEFSLVYGPRIDRETGDMTMELYARYEGDLDADITWNARIDYSKYDLDWSDMEREYEFWQNKLEERFDQAELFSSRIW